MPGGSIHGCSAGRATQVYRVIGGASAGRASTGVLMPGGLAHGC